MKLIDKDNVVAEIKSYISNYKEIVAKTNMNNSTWVDSVSMIDAKIDLLQHLLFFLDTLEVKDVDLDFQTFAKEMDAVFALPSTETKNTEENPLNWEYAIAKHFFELGLKVVQKGE